MTRSKGFTAHVIGFGLSTEEEQASIACIAERTGGRFIAASDAAELGDALAAVGAEVASADEPEPEQEAEPVQEVSVEVLAPASVTAGSTFDVSWSRTVEPADFVTVVSAGADEGTVDGHIRVGDKSGDSLRAPAEPGLCEVRYVLEKGRRTLARATVEVVGSTATLDTGGTAPGEEIEVSWTSSSTSARQRVSLAESNHPDFTWIEAQPATNEPPLIFTMPEAPGLYEIRLLDLEGPSVLSRATIEVR